MHTDRPNGDLWLIYAYPKCNFSPSTCNTEDMSTNIQLKQFQFQSGMPATENIRNVSISQLNLLWFLSASVAKTCLLSVGGRRFPQFARLWCAFSRFQHAFYKVCILYSYSYSQARCIKCFTTAAPTAAAQGAWCSATTNWIISTAQLLLTIFECYGYIHQVFYNAIGVVNNKRINISDFSSYSYRLQPVVGNYTL